MTREKLIGELDAAATMPGVANIWTQPIINRINMLTTGIRSEVGVKLFGHDLRPWRSGRGRSPRCCGASLAPSMSIPSR